MSNELQFGYKKGASTVLCTALLDNHGYPYI